MIKGAFLAPDRPTRALKQFWESIVKEYCLLGSGMKLTGSEAALWAQGVRCSEVSKAPESHGVLLAACSAASTALKPGSLLLLCIVHLRARVASLPLSPYYLTSTRELLIFSETCQPSVRYFSYLSFFVSRRNCFPQLEILLYSFMF